MVDRMRGGNVWNVNVFATRIRNKILEWHGDGSEKRGKCLTWAENQIIQSIAHQTIQFTNGLWTWGVKDLETRIMRWERRGRKEERTWGWRRGRERERWMNTIRNLGTETRSYEPDQFSTFVSASMSLHPCDYLTLTSSLWQTLTSLVVKQLKDEHQHDKFTNG